MPHDITPITSPATATFPVDVAAGAPARQALLAYVARQRRRVLSFAVTTALVRACVVGLLLAAFVATADAYWPLPAVWRAVYQIFTLAALVAFVLLTARRAVSRHTLTTLAGRLDGLARSHGQIRAAVDLALQPEPAHPVTRRLTDDAIRRATQLARVPHPAALVPPTDRRAARFGWLVLSALLACLWAGWLTLPATHHAAHRLLNPWGELLPTRTAVATAATHAPTLTSSPALPLQAAQVTFRITPPDTHSATAYTGPLPASGLLGPPGTQVEVTVHSDQPLAHGSMTLTPSPLTPSTMTPSPTAIPSHDATPSPSGPDASTFTTTPSQTHPLTIDSHDAHQATGSFVITAPGSVTLALQGADGRALAPFTARVHLPPPPLTAWPHANAADGPRTWTTLLHDHPADAQTPSPPARAASRALGPDSPATLGSSSPPVPATYRRQVAAYFQRLADELSSTTPRTPAAP